MDTIIQHIKYSASKKNNFKESIYLVISLKRNSKGKLIEARGLRTRKSSIYVPGQTETFRISRSKFNDFLTCRRCFYLDRVIGVISPSTPGWTLNETTDILLKKEFDALRKTQLPHRIFEAYGLNNVIPFSHPDLDHWRNSLHGGLEGKIEGTNIVLHGGIDDLWYDTSKEEVIIVDYKSQANKYPVTQEYYLSNVHHESYKIQLDVYGYLLNKIGFAVSNIGFFYVCNANRNANSFEGKMLFEENLVPYQLDRSWIEDAVKDMTNVLNCEQLPEINPHCENCAYSRERARIEGIIPA